MAAGSYTSEVRLIGNAHLHEHRHELIDGFTGKHGIKRLISYEVCDDPLTAIEHEKQLKRWSRSKKPALVRRMIPSFNELRLAESA